MSGGTSIVLVLIALLGAVTIIAVTTKITDAIRCRRCGCHEEGNHGKED
ncbi:MAG TPA: hypothetical protein VFQ44_02035 [Streptosporangiaceae bacterium]|nr:hypothetical protein [Streptosporangiaceae bacterium]